MLPHAQFVEIVTGAGATGSEAPVFMSTAVTVASSVKGVADLSSWQVQVKGTVAEPATSCGGAGLAATQELLEPDGVLVGITEVTRAVASPEFASESVKVMVAPAATGPLGVARRGGVGGSAAGVCTVTEIGVGGTASDGVETTAASTP